MKKVGVVGFGYVGKGIANLMSKAHFVIAYDPHLGMSTSREAINDCDVVFICVPTPSGPVGECDTRIVSEVLEWIKGPVICIKSTVAPGYTDHKAARLGKVICFSPEFMGEPTNFVPPWKYPDPRRAEQHDFVIVGGNGADEVLQLYYPILSTDSRFIGLSEALPAELAKYMENTFFALKVGFCNEWAEICQAFGVPYHVVRELWLTDPRPGGDHTVVNPDNPGFGGKCLPKDLDAIIHACFNLQYWPHLLTATARSNTMRRNAAARRIEDETSSGD